MVHDSGDFLRCNRGIMSDIELEKIAGSRILLVGLGGLGGHIANSLVRLGVRSIAVVDFDHFTVPNLNRQLFSSLENIGKHKVDVIIENLVGINPKSEIIAYHVPVQEIDVSAFDETDMIIDAVDTIETKLWLEKVAQAHNKPLLHGAIGGWYGQVGISLPNSNLLHNFYQGANDGLERTLRCPTFVPPIIANIMVAEMVKYLLGRSPNLANQIMMVDMLHNDSRIVMKV